MLDRKSGRELYMSDVRGGYLFPFMCEETHPRDKAIPRRSPPLELDRATARPIGRRVSGRYHPVVYVELRYRQVVLSLVLARSNLLGVVRE